MSGDIFSHHNWRGGACYWHLVNGQDAAKPPTMHKAGPVVVNFMSSPDWVMMAFPNTWVNIFLRGIFLDGINLGSVHNQ